MPSKPTKYGMKVWLQADPYNGYCNQIQFYNGRCGSGVVEGGLGARVVRDLTRPICHTNMIVNCNNFFTSPALFNSLLDDGLYARGMVRCDRKGMPPAAVFGKKQLTTQGESLVLQKECLVAVRWLDKKTVPLLTTADSATAEGKRKCRDGSSSLVLCLAVVEHYNTYMGGVDHADQLRHDLPTFRTSKKWWPYAFWFLYDICMCNAFILMRELPAHQMKTKKGKAKPRQLLDFKMELSKHLIGHFRCSRKRSLVPSIDPDGNSHLPIIGKKGWCAECTHQKRGRHESITRWEACGVALCRACFANFNRVLVSLLNLTVKSHNFFLFEILN